MFTSEKILCIYIGEGRGPRESGLDQNCTCTTRPWDQQYETINRYLQYLVTEEIEEQDIVYGQTDEQTAEWPDDGRKGIA